MQHMHAKTKKRAQVDIDEAYSPERTRLGWLADGAKLAPVGAHNLSADEQQRWRERLYAFPRGMVEGPGGGADAIELDQIDEFFGAARDMLACWRGDRAYLLSSRQVNVRWQVSPGGVVKLMGDVVSMCKFEAMPLLAGDDAKKWLRVCPSCSRVFAARKNAVHCSPQCSNREEKRRYRARQKARAAEMEAKARKRRTKESRK